MRFHTPDSTLAVVVIKSPKGHLAVSPSDGVGSSSGQGLSVRSIPTTFPSGDRPRVVMPAADDGPS